MFDRQPGRRACLAARRFPLLSLALIISLACSWSFNTGDAVKAQNVAVTPSTISTIAGGGFGANAPARQSPMELPTAVVFDPQGRGFYLVDEIDGASLLRFVNTSANPVTLAGASILPNNINLVAGGGTRADEGSPARDADLAEVTGLAVDATGNAVVFSSPAFSALRAVNVGAQAVTVAGRNILPGTVSTVATPDFADLRGVAFHPVSRELFFIAGALVYRIDASGARTPYAGGGNPPNNGNGDGGPARSARLVNPRGLAFDANNNLLIAEGGNPRSDRADGAIRRVTANGTINSVAAGLAYPVGVAAAPNGNVYAALGNEQQLLCVTPNGTKNIVAGNATGLACDQLANPTCGDGGPGANATLNLPDSAANETLVFAAENRGVYLPDYHYRRVRFVNLSGAPATILGTTINAQQINTIAGSGLPAPFDTLQATSAELSEPAGITVDGAGNLFIADTRSNRLRFVNRSAQPVTLFQTTPAAVTVQPGQIVTLNKNAGELDEGRINTATFSSPQGLLATDKGVLIVDSQAGALIKIPPTSVSGRRSGVIRFLNTTNQGVVFFPNGGDARVVIAPGEIKDIAGVRPPANPQALGDGLTANQVAFFPTDLALDGAGNLYLADQANHRIRRIDAGNAVVSTFYGNGVTTTLNRPTGIAFDNSGRLLIADTRNQRILRQTAAGANTYVVIADQTRNIRLPRDLAVDSSGKIFVTNAGSHQVLDLTAPENQLGAVSVVAGNGAQGFSGDGGPSEQARLSFPQIGTAINDIQLTANILVQGNGDILFTDTGNSRVRLLRRVTKPVVTTISAASFLGNEVAAESMAAGFGTSLATRLEIANSLPLPTTLAGTTVKVRDSAGTERLAPLFFVSPTQINYLIPAGTVNGTATVTVTSGDGAESVGTVNIAQVAPGLFAANANGRGVAAAVILRVKTDGTQSFETMARFDNTQNMFVPIPVDLGPAGEQVFVILFGSGLRFRGNLSAVTIRLGGADAESNFAGATGGLAGLDQVNARIPRSLLGRGAIDIAVTVEGKAANILMMQIR